LKQPLFNFTQKVNRTTVNNNPTFAYLSFGFAIMGFGILLLTAEPLGLFLGIPAFIFGICGLNNYMKGLAITGSVLGLMAILLLLGVL